jgi:hypothetical protein|eukprot:7388411-Prymnesium_polylepis.4
MRRMIQLAEASRDRRAREDIFDVKLQSASTDLEIEDADSVAGFDITVSDDDLDADADEPAA